MTTPQEIRCDLRPSNGRGRLPKTIDGKTGLCLRVWHLDDRRAGVRCFQSNKSVSYAKPA